MARPAALDEAVLVGTDVELVRRAQQGDHGAVDVLVDRYQGAVRGRAANYFLAGGDGPRRA